MDCCPPDSSVHGDSPGKNIGMGCHAFLQGIFLTQGSNPDLPRCKRILYQLSHWRSPSPRVGSLSLLQGIFLTQESKQGLLHCRQILYQLRYQGSPSRHGVLVKTLCTGQQVCSSMELPPLPVISLPHVNKKHNTCQNSRLKYWVLTYPSVLYIVQQQYSTLSF